MTYPLAIIGGSGIYSMDAFELTDEKKVKTPFGEPSAKLKLGKLNGQDVVFLPRHGEHHQLSPSSINYRANIWALKSLGVRAIFSVSAVGSLKEEIKPGHMVLVNQFFDRTHKREASFFNEGIVAHVTFAKPICTRLKNNLAQSIETLEIPYHNGTYVCMEGPQFSTQAESHFYRSFHADVIGMTNLTEAKLAREAEICYATLALSTDYDCWHAEHESVTTAQVLAVLKQNIANAQKIILGAVGDFQDEDCSCQHALKNAILTKPEGIEPKTREKLDLIAGKYLKN